MAAPNTPKPPSAPTPEPPGPWHFITAIIIAILITVLAIAALFLGAEGNDVSPAVFFILGTVALVALGGPEMVKFLRSKV